MTFYPNSLVFLLVVLAYFNDLCDVVVGTQIQGPNVHLDIVLQEILSQTWRSYAVGFVSSYAQKKKKNDRKQAILENGVWALIRIAYLLKYNLKFNVGSVITTNT